LRCNYGCIITDANFQARISGCEYLLQRIYNIALN
jgi:hypothetical protein